MSLTKKLKRSIVAALEAEIPEIPTVGFKPTVGPEEDVESFPFIELAHFRSKNESTKTSERMSVEVEIFIYDDMTTHKGDGPLREIAERIRQALKSEKLSNEEIAVISHFDTEDGEQNEDLDIQEVSLNFTILVKGVN